MKLSEAAQADFVKHIRPFRLDGSGLSPLKASPLERCDSHTPRHTEQERQRCLYVCDSPERSNRRSKTEGPPPTGMSRSISVDSGMNDMDNLHLSPAAKQVWLPCSVNTCKRYIVLTWLRVVGVCCSASQATLMPSSRGLLSLHEGPFVAACPVQELRTPTSPVPCDGPQQWQPLACQMNLTSALKQ